MPVTSESGTKRVSTTVLKLLILSMGAITTHAAVSQSPNKLAPDHGPSYKGRRAQGFVLRDLSGKRVALRDFAGKPIVVNFWATWCPPCLQEMPWFQELSKKYAGTGLTFLGINVEAESGEAPQQKIVATVKRLGITYPILLSDGSLAKNYGSVPSLPETFYIDKKGTIVEDVWSHTDRAAIEKYINEVIR